MDIYRYRSMIFITAIFGGASSPYEKTYNGALFALPSDDDNSPLERSLSEAQTWCTNNRPGSMLPRITEDQVNVLKFISSAVSEDQLNSGQTVLVNGIQHSPGTTWSWINGQDARGINVKNEKHGVQATLYSVGYLLTGGEYSIQASRPVDPKSFICEYDYLSGCVVVINRRCYRMKPQMLTWLQAKQDCMLNRGDLASFETLNDNTLKRQLQDLYLVHNKGYWIGIRRAIIHLDGDGSEIKSIDWKAIHWGKFSAAECLCLHVFNVFSWTECDCNRPYPFFCVQRDSKTASHVTSLIDLPSTTSAILAPRAMPITTTAPLSDQPSSNNPNAVIYAVVPCVMIVVIIIVVVVVVINIRKQRSRPRDSLRVETSEGKKIDTINECSVYEEIQEPREKKPTPAASCSAPNATYATVQPAAITDEELPPANSIVYAELDLSKQ